MLENFLKENYYDITAYYKMKSDMTIRDNNKKQNKIVQRLMQYHLESALSPEDILIQKENNKEMLNFLIGAFKHVKDDTKLHIVLQHYIHRKSLRTLAKEYNLPQKTVVNYKKQVLNDFYEWAMISKFDLELLNGDVKYYEAHVPEIKIKYPFESAMNTYDKIKKRGKAITYGTKCTMPEYLAGRFNTPPVCNLCQTSGGDLKCTRKDKNIESCRTITQ